MIRYFREETKYIRIYFNIIHRAKSEHRIYNSQQYERHHILPVSLFPDKSNLQVVPDNNSILTFREHYICHLLLWKHYRKYIIDNNLEIILKGNDTSKIFVEDDDVERIVEMIKEHKSIHYIENNTKYKRGQNNKITKSIKENGSKINKRKMDIVPYDVSWIWHSSYTIEIKEEYAKT